MNAEPSGIPHRKTLARSVTSWFAWTLLSGVGFLAAMSIPWALATFLAYFGGGFISVLADVAAVIGGLAAGGLVVAPLQLLAMKSRVVSGRLWILVMAMGWAPLSVTTLFILRGLPVDPRFLVLAVLCGAILGACQSEVLRLETGGAAWWIVASSMGWLLAFLALALIVALPLAAANLIGVAVAVLVASMVMGIARETLAATAGRRVWTAGPLTVASAVTFLIVMLPISRSASPAAGVLATPENVTGIALSADGTRLASVGADRSEDHWLTVWDTGDWSQLQRIRLGYVPWARVALSPDGMWALTGATLGPGPAQLWDLSKGKAVWTRENSRAIALTPDGKTIAVTYYTDGDEWLELVDTATGVTRARTHLEDEYSAVPLAFSPDGHFLASAAAGGRISLRDVRTLEVVRTFTGQPYDVDAMEFTPDGMMLVAGGSPTLDLTRAPGHISTLRVSDVETGRDDTSIDVIAHVETLDVSPDGRMLAIVRLVSDTALVYDLAGGQLLGTLSGSRGPIYAVRFTPDGKHLILGSDRMIRLWDVADLAP